MPPKKKKPAKRKSTKAAATASGNTHTPVRVRMYRQGLGDCFLITFGTGAKAVNVLVDFGSLGATTTGVSSADVVADIRKTTKDHLDLLIVTHEHKDHLSGFRDQEAEFKKIKIDRVWLGWTENPQDAKAQDLKKYKDDLGEALAAVSAALTRTGMDQESVNLGLGITDLAEFAGDPNALGSFAKTVHAAMELVRTGFGARVRYLTPGDKALEEDWLPGFRFYILGPPPSETRIKDLGDHGSSELYHFSGGLRAGAAGLAGLNLKDLDQEQEMPFQERFRMLTRSLPRSAVLAGGGTVDNDGTLQNIGIDLTITTSESSSGWLGMTRKMRSGAGLTENGCERLRTWRCSWTA